MKKKIMFIFLGTFAFLFILAAVLFTNNQEDERPVLKDEPKVYKPQNGTTYTKIADANLTSSNADVHTLIKYGLELYGLANNQDIEGDLLTTYGTISKITSKENIPINDLETNSEEFYGAIIVRISYEEIIVEQNNNVYKFYRIGD